MTKRKRYRVLTGINYPPGDKRAEAGDVVDDLPPTSIAWLLRDGIVEEYVPRQHTPKELEAAEPQVRTDEELAADAGADAAAAIDALDDGEKGG